MAFKRANRAGQVIRLPLTSDPEYRARRQARIASGERESVVEAEEVNFRATLDASCLRTDLADVTHVTIRGLSGEAFAIADEQASLAVTKARIDDDERRSVRYVGANVAAIVRAGLVDSGLDGLPIIEAGEYPIERIYGPGGIGAAWPAYSAEVFGFIHSWSHLGNSVSSSCAPSHGEPS